MEYIHRVFHVKSLIRYALALIVVLAALFARQVLVNALGGGLPPFITFYPAVMLIALLGGLGAGIFATIAATLFAIYYVIPPPNGFSVDFSTDIAGLSVFFCMGLAISIVSELYKRNGEKISSCEKELEKTKVSDEIRLKDTLLHLTGEMARIGGWEFDAVSGKGTWTDEVALIHDLDPADPTNVNLGISFYSGKSRELIENALKDAIESAKPYDLELEMVTGRGNHKIVRTMGLPIMENSKVTKVRGIFQDITENRQAEEKIKAQDRMLKLFVEYAPAAIAMFDRDMKYLAVSRRFIADYRLTEQDIIGLSHYEIFPEIPESVRETHRRCLEGSIEKKDEDAFARADGTLDWVRWAVHPWHEESGEIGGIILFSEVITEQMLVKNRIKESEEKYRLLIDSIKKEYFIYRNDINGVFTYVSPSVTDVLGYSDAELGKHYKEFLTDNPVNLKVDRYVELCSEGVTQPSFEVEIRHKDGSIRYLEIVLTPLFDPGGKVDSMQGIAHDITERKRLDSERERMITAIEQAGEAIVVTDINGIIQYINPAFETITGYSHEEVVGNSPRILKSGEHDEAFYSELWQKISSGQTWSGRMVNRRKNGKLYTEAATISPVRDSSGKIINFVAVKKDITDIIQLEKQFRQAQKMESVGRLAGGVAHDFNNMLSVILGYSELALTKIAVSDPMYENFQQIYNAAMRSRDLTKQLLAFARKETITPEVLNLNETIESMLKILRKLIGEDINLVWRPVSGLWSVKFDPTQLNQILANLCVNSRDAIDNVGHITIETDMVTFDDEYCKDHPEAMPGDFVMLAVSDDGCGMSKETMDKIFEPFFTTKKSGQGTGLGLATVYGIVKQSNGFIYVYSEPGQGTTFKIYLPRYVGKEIDETRKKATEIPRGRGETVLVVEDEVSILMLISTILQSIGYKVLTVDRPEEAIRLAQEYTETIHLLLTDVIIPGMNGKELAEKLMSSHPHLRCIYMSGYTADTIAHRGVLDEGVNFLQKPFSTKDLAVKVRMALDQKSD